jgi:hypothetical protein
MGSGRRLLVVKTPNDPIICPQFWPKWKDMFLIKKVLGAGPPLFLSITPPAPL